MVHHNFGGESFEVMHDGNHAGQQEQGIDTEYNKRLDCQRPCLEGDFNGGSNNIVQSNKSV